MPRATEITAAVPEHRPLVRKAAEESFVLLKNDPTGQGHPLLPFSTEAKKIALIGPLGDNPGEMMGSWSGGPELADVVTIRGALEARAKQTGGSVVYAKGNRNHWNIGRRFCRSRACSGTVRRSRAGAR